MIGSRTIAGKRQQRLSWGLLSFLAIYLLSLCTQCLPVHADLLHQQVAQAHHTSAEHCSVPQTARPLAAERERTSGPVCCDLMGTDKATSASPAQTVPSPPLVLTTLLPKTSPLAGGVQPLSGLCIPAIHPPLLYLLYSVLLI